MTNTQANALEKLERRPPLPRMTELLDRKSIPLMDSPPSSPSPSPSFDSEIPAATSARNPAPPSLPELNPIPGPGSLRDFVPDDMSIPLMPMPAPAITPIAEKNLVSAPLPVPEEISSPAAPAAGPPFIDAEPVETAPKPAPKSGETLSGFEEIESQANDTELLEALLPVVETTLEKALETPKTGLHMHLEPMLRATIRRALSEQLQTVHHFGKISIFDRISWRLRALFTSRTYDDIIFERTHRYRVEEVYLLRYQSNSLISYASHDPSRHATPRKIKYDLSRLVEELEDGEGELLKSFDLPNRNTAVVRSGQHCFLLASVKGPLNALIRADLDYVLTQVEQRFGERLRDQSQHFVEALQPLLEGCLLIQSPLGPR